MYTSVSSGPPCVRERFPLSFLTILTLTLSTHFMCKGRPSGTKLYMNITDKITTKGILSMTA